MKTLDADTLRAARAYDEHIGRRNLKDALEAQNILQFLLGDVRKQLTSLMPVRHLYKADELAKHPFSVLCSWVTRIVHMHWHDNAMRAWWLHTCSYYAGKDDAIETLCVTIARHCATMYE